MKKPLEPIDSRTRLSRRRLLGGMGALAVSLTSPIWKVSTAFGKDGGVSPARRFIGVFSANGTVASEFFPGCSSLLAKSPNSMRSGGEGGHGDAADDGEPGQDSPAARGARLADGRAQGRRHDLDGVRSARHDDEQARRASHEGPRRDADGGLTADRELPGRGRPRRQRRSHLGRSVHREPHPGPPRRFPSLEFGVRVIGGAPLNTISYSGANQPNVPIYDPTQMYTQMFANSKLSATQLQQLIADRKSVLDFLQSDITTLETRLTAADKARLDAHLTQVRTMEQQLTNAAAACKAPAAPLRSSTRTT